MKDRLPRRLPRTLLAASLVAGLLVLALVWKWKPAKESTKDTIEEAPDPRLTFPTPYRNVRPDVKYVGDQACADCHAELCDSYRHHPMGQAMAPVAEATPIERFEPAASNPFTTLGLHYAVERRKGGVWHREWAADVNGKRLTEVEAEVSFSVGSGANARSYIVNHDGYLFESPITWYAKSQRWDLSPSYEQRNRHFGRAITPGCLFCHCNQADWVPGTTNRYRQPIFRGYSIGCERCHGPGELHVRRHTGNEAAAGPDDTIVNPAHLEHSLRQDVCYQCHLQGEQRVLARGRADFDFRPGLPLHLFLMTFVNDRPSDGAFVSAAEQMAASRCYAASREPNRLGCVSCHDPHRHPTPKERVSHYRRRCLQCHAEADCSLPLDVRRARNAEDSCIACHMPRSGSEVNHASITDHRVARRPLADTGGLTPRRSPAPQRITPGPEELLPFLADSAAIHDKEFSRNFGVALMAMLDRGPPEGFAHRYAAKALPLLEASLQRDARDGPALKARGDALWSLDRREEALAAYEAVLALEPPMESALHEAGNLALALDRPEAARAYFERAIGVNPWQRQYHHGLAVALFRLGEWHRASRKCEESLRLEPFNAATRSLLIQCRLALGQNQEALADFETLLQLTAQDRRESLRSWFNEQQRRF
jgi:hypothetical protein